MTKYSFSSFLKEKRVRKGLSLQDLSNRLSEKRKEIGWYPDKSQLSRWETGKTIPSAKHRATVKAMADILDMDDREKNELLARAGLSLLRPEEMDVDAILSTLRPRWRQSFFLSKWMGWNKEQIANKLGVPWFEVMHDIEKAEERLESETKEETKVEQNQSIRLPYWVDRAQWEHLEGREVTQWTEGREIITGVVTYPGGISIRQQLEFFKGWFPEIDPRSQPFCRLPDDENVMAQLLGHLPDKAFWSQVEDFGEKAKKCDTLLDAAYEKFTLAGEELVLLSPPDLARITSEWARQVVYQALGPQLGFENLPQYLVDVLREGGSLLTCYDLLYSGPDAADAAKAKQKHRELVEDFTQAEEFNLIVSLMKDLQNLRQQIIARIDQCLRKKEYSFNYCPDCPADQARKMLTSKGE